MGREVVEDDDAQGRLLCCIMYSSKSGTWRNVARTALGWRCEKRESTRGQPQAQPRQGHDVCFAVFPRFTNIYRIFTDIYAYLRRFTNLPVFCGCIFVSLEYIKRWLPLADDDRCYNIL